MSDRQTTYTNFKYDAYAKQAVCFGHGTVRRLPQKEIDDRMHWLD